MSETIAYDDAVEVLEADHKAVKKMFIDYAAMCEDDAPAPRRRALAGRICEALTVHAQVEEELFYPQVRKALDDAALVDEALTEHAEATQIIARIRAMKATDDGFDDTVKQLGKLIDAHVLEEREQIFLQARNAPLDLRGMTGALLERKHQLTKRAAAEPTRETA